MTDRTWVATVLPWPADGDEAAAQLEREKANAKRRILGDWLGPLPSNVADVEVVSNDERDVRGETEATITFRLVAPD